MCWKAFDERRLEQERLRDEELGRREAENEKRAEEILAERKREEPETART
jgi:hypothetical protein